MCVFLADSQPGCV